MKQKTLFTMGLQKLIILTVVISLTYGVIFEGGDGNHRIIGGQSISINDVPFQVQINYNFKLRCSGVILNQDWVLTTADCLLGLVDANITVVANETSNFCYNPPHCSARNIYVRKVVRHLDFNELTRDYDIALLNVKDVIVFDELYGPYPADLPNKNEIAATGSLTTVAGWGRQEEGKPEDIDSKLLNQVVVPVISPSTCVIAYAGYGGLTPRMMCAGFMEGGKDTCLGDSGSPLVLGKKLYGLASWGHGCGRIGYPGVYTKVSSLVPWINDNKKYTL